MVIIVLFYSFTDTFREELENTSNVPEDQIDEAIKMLKIEHALFFALIIFFDFVFHSSLLIRYTTNTGMKGCQTKLCEGLLDLSKTSF
jgi:hypothetical protein